jgi:hypothetical protein
MSDHERIWLEPEPGADPDYGRQWCQHNVWGDEATEYVRADAVEAIQKALNDYRDGMLVIGGCGDGNCLIVKPEGQHTNGGCRCYSDRMKAQRAMARGKSLAAAIEAALERKA